MLENPRKFEATDPFGRKWAATFAWHQNAISIRHADAVDVKWELSADDGTKMDKVVALELPVLIQLSKKQGRPISDAWCIRLSAEYLRDIVETWEDAEKIIVTPSLHQLEEEARKVESAIAGSKK